MANWAHLQPAITQEARRLGFDYCGFAPVREAAHADFFAGWLAAGRAGEMTYLERNQEKRRDPARLAEHGAPPFRTVIALGVNYHQFDLPPAVRDDPSRGVIAAYAWGDDYHDMMRPLLYELDAFIRHHTGRTTLGKCLVDTGPVLERDWAAAAGFAFIGKNCCSINLDDGSWHFLATILVPELLVADAMPSAHTPAPRRRGTCGRCVRCLTACPTDAFVGPYDLDPLRCISYWTIEARDIIPRPLRPAFGNRIFGCDICQEVCPYNRRLRNRTPLMDALRAHQEQVAPPLLQGFEPAFPYWLEETAFSERFHGSPVKRPKRHGMLRNVCVALGNWAVPAATPALVQALHDQHPLPRAHAAWGLGQILAQHHDSRAASALQRALDSEEDGRVLEEIRLALGG